MSIHGNDCQLFQIPRGSIEATTLLVHISLKSWLSNISNWVTIESGFLTASSMDFSPNNFFKRLAKIVTLTDCPSDASDWTTTFNLTDAFLKSNLLWQEQHVTSVAPAGTNSFLRQFGLLQMWYTFTDPFIISVQHMISSTQESTISKGSDSLNLVNCWVVRETPLKLRIFRFVT